MFSNFGNQTSTFGGAAFPNTTQQTSVFGQPQQPAASTSLFGGGFNQPKTTFGSTFGAPQNTNTMFGQQSRLPVPQSGGMFSGQTATVSPFSGGQPQMQIAGTSVQFSAITGTDTMMKNGTPAQINTRHQCITCMKEYENKSLEELRLEDYQLNRKGPQQGGLFGSQQPQQATGLFSSIGASTASSPFGQTSTFGAPTNTTGGGLFSNMNQPKPVQGGFFSTPATSTAGFGAANPAFSFNTNTANQPTSVFGAANNNPVSSGGTLGTQNTFSFGQPAQPTASLFGQKPLNTATTSAFGGFGGSSFTNTTTQNKTLGFSGFGGNATSTFGSTPTTGFGTGTGSLFGSPQTQQNKPGFSFATPFSSQSQPTQPTFGSTVGSSFAFPAASSAPSINFGTGSNTFGGGLNTGSTNTFGAAPLSFGGTQPNTGFGSFGLNTSTTPGFSNFTASTSFAQTNLLQQQQQQAPAGSIAFATTPYKDSPLFYNLIANRNLEEMVKPTSPSAQRAIKEASRRRTSTSLSFSATTPIKNVSFSSNKSSSFNKSIFDGFEDDEKGITIDILSPKNSVKKLNIKNFRTTSVPTQRHGITFSPSTRLSNTCIDNGLNDSACGDFNTSRHIEMGAGDFIQKNKTMDDFSITALEKEVGFVPSQKRYSDADRSLINGMREKRGCGVINTRAGYYVSPTIESLNKSTDEAGNCFVKGLVIGRQNHGEIRFLDTINVAGINIDEIVHFRHKEVVVYPDDNNKPPLGEGLNCPAYVTLERVWPIDKVTKDPIKHPTKLQSMGYEDMLRRACSRLSSEFVSYKAENGVWVFKVPHFSKYSCELEESEDGTKAEQGVIAAKGLGGISMASPPPNQPMAFHSKMATQKPKPQELLVSENMKKWPLRTEEAEPELVTLFRAPGPFPAASLTAIPSPSQEDSTMFTCGDVEHNPLTPSESNDSDIDWLHQNIQNGRGGDTFEPTSVLKGKSESTAVLMMKSILMSDPEEEYEDFQPPTKKSRAPTLRIKDIASRNIEIKVSAASQRKSLVAIQQNKPGPPVSSLVSLKESDHKLTTTLSKNYLTSIKKKSEIQLKPQVEDAFSKLSLSDGPKIRKSSRVCFGPMGMFLHVVNPTGLEERPVVNVKRINSYANNVHPAAASPIEALEKQMDLQLNSDGPLVLEHIKLLSTMGAQTYSNNIHLKAARHELMMWELCQILWPMQEEDPSVVRDIGFVIRQRKELSAWLKKYCSDLFCDQLGDASPKTILGLLKMGRRRDACGLAVKMRNYVLAMCLAQKPMTKSTTSNCEEQLKIWGQEGALKFIEDDIQKIFRLCCGKTIMGNLKISEMSTAEWLQHFALHLWYACPAHMTVNKIVMSYQSLLKAGLRKQSNIKEDEIDNIIFPSIEDSSLPNLCIQLLKLYSFPGYPLRTIVDPRTSNPDCLEYKMSWLLMINLEKFGYVCDHELYGSMNTAFAGQLEQIGLFHWAAFVMRHLPSIRASEIHVQRLLERNLGSLGSIDKENFLAVDLGIPHKIIFSAKAMQAAVDKRKDRLIWYLLKAGEYQKAFNAFQSAISIDTVTSNNAMPCMLVDLEHLKQYANEIRGWYSHGAFLLDYIRLFVAKQSLPGVMNQSAGFDTVIASFVNAFVQYESKSPDECALLLELVLSAQKIVAVLMDNNPDYVNEFGTEDKITSFMELPIPKEYIEELQYFLTRWLVNQQ